MVVYNIGWFLNLILPSRTVGITLGPFGIYIRKDRVGDFKLLTHEFVHWQQQKEMFYIFFYLWYLIEWIVKSFKYGTRKAYNNLSFEREANFGENKDCYSVERKPYAWLLYL